MTYRSSKKTHSSPGFWLTDHPGYLYLPLELYQGLDASLIEEPQDGNTISPGEKSPSSTDRWLLGLVVLGFTGVLTWLSAPWVSQALSAQARDIVVELGISKAREF